MHITPIGDTKKSPLGDLGVAEYWQSWKAATRNPVEALQYE
jgi:hypothetical protein